LDTEANTNLSDVQVGIKLYQKGSRYRVSNPGQPNLQTPQTEKNFESSQSGQKSVHLLSQMEAKNLISSNQTMAMNRMSPLQHPSVKHGNSASLRVNHSMPSLQQMRGMRPVDDQSINNRLRQLQEQKREIANLALKYELRDDSRVETLTLLSLRNPNMGHHHHHGNRAGNEDLNA